MKLTDGQWREVFQLRCRSKQGHQISKEGRALVDAAFNEDPERYGAMEPDEDPLNPEDRKILNFMFANLNMSPREVAKHFGITVEHVHDILARDLRWVTTG